MANLWIDEKWNSLENCLFLLPQKPAKAYAYTWYTLWNIISHQQNETVIHCVLFYSSNFLKPVHVQNVQLLTQFIPNNVSNNSVNGISLMTCSIFNVPPVFVVLWRTPSSLNLPKGSNQEIEAGASQQFIFVLFISDWICDRGNVSHLYGNEVEFSLDGSKFHCYSQIISAWNHDFRHLQVSLTHDNLFEEIRLPEDRSQRTVIHGTLTAFSSMMYGFTLN